MLSPRDTTQRLGVVCLLTSTWSTLAAGLDLDLCASMNTAQTPQNISIFQSNGLCHDFCIDEYAYAITQDKACWCSNYAPGKSSQQGLSSCDTPCPAYPPEDCGGKGLYGYLELGKILPSGTQEPSTSDATETSSETSTRTTSSLIQTVTADGTIKTVTIGPTATGHSASDNSGVSVKSGGLSTGEVVGIVVGVIGAVIIAAGLALFFWFRRKKQRTQEEDFQDDPSIRGSSSGMMAARPDMTMTGGSPVSGSAATNRNSTLQIDPRMDPFKQGLYVRSASHESVNTLRDDHDYSRRIQAPKVLRATNPDPEPSS